MTDFDPDKLKHKPNEKHTLDEVLKSLQDLIHNDLLKGEGTRAQPAPAEPAPTADAAPAERGEAALPVADLPLGTVVQSLEELVNRDLAPSEDEAAPAVAKTAEPAPKPTAGQQTFSFDEPAPAAEPPAAIDSDEFTVDLAPPDEAVAEEVTAAPAPEADDLPVLTESVAHPPSDGLPVLEEIALAPENNPVAIAARVVARLNADRRARGEAELDDATLDALRVLLRDEIERHRSER